MIDDDVAIAAKTVGLNLKLYREAVGMTQAQLGRALGPILGQEWSRQAASAAEKGVRSFTAAELLSLSKILGVSIGDFFRKVDLPDATSVDPRTSEERLRDAIGSRPTL